jgi:hypothetical protein
MPLPQETAAPQWIKQAESAADTAKWIFAGIAGVLGVLLLIGAVRRGHSRSQSNKAMDHLEGATYRDYSVAPKGRRRSEIVSGEEERSANAAGTPEAGELPQAAETKDAGSDDLMAETLKRLYDEPTESVQAAAAGTAAAVEETAGAAEEAAQETVQETAEADETVKIEAENAPQTTQEATRRRRAGRK